MADLSLLDLVPVGEGIAPTDALRRSTELVQVAEALGYRRYWVAEHHNMPGIASTSPPVLIAHLAARSRTIRVGSGGVMLPNHAPLVVAEQFRTLAALHPGRIDLGIGRAPGTDPLTAAAIRFGRTEEALDEFPRALTQLLGYLEDRVEGVGAYPRPPETPEVWLLGSSDYSAQLAGVLGRPFSFAHHFSARNTLPALAAYRHRFDPSDALDRPHAMVAVSVICAEDDERAAWLAGPSKLSFLRRRTGRPQPLPTPEEAARHVLSPFEEELLRSWGSGAVIGGPETVRHRLAALLADTSADEVMVTTMTHGHEDRVRSHELVAELWPAVEHDAATATATSTSGSASVR